MDSDQRWREGSTEKTDNNGLGGQPQPGHRESAEPGELKTVEEKDSLCWDLRYSWGILRKIMTNNVQEQLAGLGD